MAENNGTAVVQDTLEKLAAVEEKNCPCYSDPRILDCLSKLYEIRKDGSLKLSDLDEEIYDIRNNKMIDEKTRATILASDKAAVQKAHQHRAKMRNQEDILVQKALALVKEVSIPYETKLKQEGQAIVQSAVAPHQRRLAKIDDEHAKEVAAIKEQFTAKVASANPEEHKKLAAAEKAELASEKIAYNTNRKDEITAFEVIRQAARDNSHTAYLARFNKCNEIRGNKNSIAENIGHKWENYKYLFVPKTFLTNNALYFIVILFFIVCTIISPLTGQGLLWTQDSLSVLLENMSVRTFYALGVAGLILLGGTDLSIGRLIGLGTIITGIILHNGPNSITLFGKTGLDFSGLGFAPRVLLALFLTVFATTLVSAIAGFFSAKFKMHPFITTLSTMLMTYGLMLVITSGNPTGPVDTQFSGFFLGTIGNFLPKYLIYAIIALIIVWFIWNKTKFGKNMYAIGGNPEAAAVSGISYFKVTFLVFIMAGILYGFGSFFFAMKTNSTANNGYGYELDAIASCVIGGISFFGGIGKVQGALLGVLIFEGMSLCLTMLGLSSNWQFIIKGAILMTAVALDSVKYLKKK
jgi:methyl-galactoside transport system permease protein